MPLNVKATPTKVHVWTEGQKGLRNGGLNQITDVEDSPTLATFIE